MSRFTGRCDLYDHIYMIGQNGKTKEECFEEFKAATGGKMTQIIKIKLTPWNVEKEAAKNGFLKINTITKEVPDKRTKAGTRTVVSHTYEYLGKTYNSLEDLNKKQQYYGRKVIEFNDMLDLIPYYGYCIASVACSKDPISQTVCLAAESEIDERERSWMEGGFDTQDMLNDFRDQIRQEYIDIISSRK